MACIPMPFPAQASSSPDHGPEEIDSNPVDAFGVATTLNGGCRADEGPYSRRVEQTAAECSLMRRPVARNADTTGRSKVRQNGISRSGTPGKSTKRRSCNATMPSK